TLLALRIIDCRDVDQCRELAVRVALQELREFRRCCHGDRDDKLTTHNFCRKGAVALPPQDQLPEILEPGIDHVAHALRLIASECRYAGSSAGAGGCHRAAPPPWADSRARRYPPA